MIKNKISEKLVLPTYPYIKAEPINKKPDEIEPIKKYFKPASIEIIEFCFELAKIYKDKLCNSITKYNKIISYAEIKTNILYIDKINIRKYSIFEYIFLVL